MKRVAGGGPGAVLAGDLRRPTVEVAVHGCLAAPYEAQHRGRRHLPQPAVAAWVSNPINATLLLVLIAVTFQHMHLGLQVICEDYVSNKWQMTLMILGAKAASLVLGLLASVAVLKLALT